MVYLLPAEYAGFGLEAETSDAVVRAASAMIDAHCRRASLGVTSYTERLRVGRAGEVVLSYGPVVSVTAVRARYAARRDAEGFGAFVAASFGLHGQWAELDAAAVEVGPAGEISLGDDVLGVGYREVEVAYTAGLAVVPDAVKVACAQVVRNMQATPALNVKSARMDTLQTEYFSDALMDSEVRALLRPYVAERMS